MIYIHLFWEFMKIGLFAVGGGMATLPFLQRLSESASWYPQSFIIDMVATLDKGKHDKQQQNGLSTLPKTPPGCKKGGVFV